MPLWRKQKNDLLKKALENKPDLFGAHGSFEKAVEEEFIKQLKHAGEILNGLSPEQKTLLSSISGYGKKSKNAKSQDDSFIKALDKKKEAMDKLSIEDSIPKIKLGNYEGGQEAIQKE